jgi:hypothetical protein
VTQSAAADEPRPRFLKSPRARRRALFIAVPLLIAGAIAGAISLIPNTTPQAVGPKGNEGPAQTVAPTVTHVSASERSEIDKVLDQFIPAAVERKNAAVAWSLAGPGLKASSSLAEWKQGNLPVPSYPARGAEFHGWGVLDAQPGDVNFNLLVHPQAGAKLGSYTFHGEMVKQHGKWLVNGLYTAAIDNPVRNGQHEVGPADFGAPGGGSTSPTKTRLGSDYLIPIVAILSAAFVIPLVLGLVVFLRSRRRKRQIRAEGRTELPPLPSSFKPK